MIDKPHSVVVIPTQLLEDLCQMARKSPQYREGYSWTASAMHQANRLLAHQKYREGTASKEDLIYIDVTTQGNI